MGSKVLSICFLVDRCSGHLAGADGERRHKQFMTDVDWGAYYLVSIFRWHRRHPAYARQTIPLPFLIVTRRRIFLRADARKGTPMFIVCNRLASYNWLFRVRTLRQREKFCKRWWKTGCGRTGRSFLARFLSSRQSARAVTGKPIVGMPAIRSKAIHSTAARHLAAQISIRNAPQAAAPALDIQ